MVTILKLICLFVGVWSTIVNVTRMYHKNDIPFGNMFLQALGIVGFIILQFKLYQ